MLNRTDEFRTLYRIATLAPSCPSVSSSETREREMIEQATTERETIERATIERATRMARIIIDERTSLAATLGELEFPPVLALLHISLPPNGLRVPPSLPSYILPQTVPHIAARSSLPYHGPLLGRQSPCPPDCRQALQHPDPPPENPYHRHHPRSVHTCPPTPRVPSTPLPIHARIPHLPLRPRLPSPLLRSPHHLHFANTPQPSTSPSTSSASFCWQRSTIRQALLELR